MSTETKRYRLLKDLPDHKSGTIFVYDKSRHKYKTELEAINAADPYSCYMRKFVENNPEWFELIPEQSKMPKQERIEVHLRKSFDTRLDWAAHLYSSEKIEEDKFPLIKEAIEQALNPTTDKERDLSTEEIDIIKNYKPNYDFSNPDTDTKTYTQQEVDSMLLKVKEETLKNCLEVQGLLDEHKKDAVSKEDGGLSLPKDFIETDRIGVQFANGEKMLKKLKL